MEEGDRIRPEETEAFRELVRRKRAFVVPVVIFVFLFFFTLPVLTAFTTVLNGKAIGSISWAYLYAFAQFFVAWIVALLYWRKAKQFDELARKARQEASERREASA